MTFFDTAEAYGPFANEELVGEALGPVRDQVVITTKFGGSSRTAMPPWAWTAGPNLRAVADACSSGCRPTASTFSISRAIPNVPIEDVAGTVRELIRDGKVRHSACRRGAPDHPAGAAVAAGVGGAKRVFAVVARPRRRSLPALEELGVGFVPFSPLGGGFLTGQIDEDTSSSDGCPQSGPRFTAGGP